MMNLKIHYTLFNFIIFNNVQIELKRDYLLARTLLYLLGYDEESPFDIDLLYYLSYLNLLLHNYCLLGKM